MRWWILGAVLAMAGGCEERDTEPTVASSQGEVARESADDIVERARAAGREADMSPDERAVYDRALEGAVADGVADDLAALGAQPDRAAMGASYACAGALLDLHLVSSARADLARPSRELTGGQAGERDAIQADVMSAVMGETHAGHGCRCDERASSACRQLVQSAAGATRAER